MHRMLLDRRVQILLCIGGIVAAVLVTYGGVLRHDFVRWDDPQLIFENPLVMRFTPRIFFSYDPELYIPLTLLTFQIEHALVGFHPFLFHLDNLLLHALNAVLVFLFLSTIFRDRFAAFLGALLFAVHPLHAEAVSWVSARKELLFTACTLGALLAFLQGSKGLTHARVVSLLLFFLALLAKPTAIVFPLLLVLLALREGDPRSLHVLRRAWPFTLLACLFLLIAVIGQRESTFVLPPVQFLLLAFRSIAFTLTKLFLPLHLSALYPAPEITLADPAFFLSAFLIITLAALLFRLRHRFRDIAFGVGFFLVTLAPSLFSYRKADMITLGADHYAYLPSVGWIIALVALASLLATTRARRFFAVILVAIVLIALSRLTSVQAGVWKTTETLFQDVLTKEPDAYIAKNNLGFFYLSTGRLDEALPLFLDAVRLRSPFLDAHLNLAAVYARKGMLNDAAASTRRALALSPDDPRAHFNLAGIHFLRGGWESAVLSYRTVLELEPDSIPAHLQLARSFLRQGKRDEARAVYERALALAPDLRGRNQELDALLP